MRSAVISAVSLLAAGAVALPSPHGGWWGPNGFQNAGSQCLSDAAAQKVATNFQDLISAYTDALANDVLSTTVNDYTDSVIELIDYGGPTCGNVALGSATFSSLAAFEAGQGGQPNITFELLNVWHNCDTVTLRWRSPTPNPGPGAPAVQQQVTGIVVLETVPSTADANQPFLIQNIYSEFNSGAWLYDLGAITYKCSGSTKRSASEALTTLPRML